MNIVPHKLPYIYTHSYPFTKICWRDNTLAQRYYTHDALQGAHTWPSKKQNHRKIIKKAHMNPTGL